MVYDTMIKNLYSSFLIIVWYKWRNQIISGTSPPLSMIKNLYSNLEMNTGHIDTLKNVPRSCDLDLSNAPKNAKNGLVWKIKLSTQQVTCTHPGCYDSSFYSIFTFYTWSLPQCSLSFYMLDSFLLPQRSLIYFPEHSLYIFLAIHSHQQLLYM